MVKRYVHHLNRGKTIVLVCLAAMIIFGAVRVSRVQAQGGGGATPHPGSNVTTKIKSVNITTVNAMGSGVIKPGLSWRITVKAKFSGSLHHSTVLCVPRSATQVGAVQVRTYSGDGTGLAKFTLSKSLGYTHVDIYSIAADTYIQPSGHLATAKASMLDVPLQ